MKRQSAFVMLTGIAIFMALAFAFRAEVLRGEADFTMLYSGGRLAANRDLYDQQRFIEAQARLTMPVQDNMQFARLPHIAALFWPLSQLPYLTAHRVWLGISLALLVISGALWCRMQGPDAVIVFALSIPLMMGLLNLRDDSVFLLGLTLAIWSLRNSKPFQAGLCLTLCLTLWHVLAPVVVLTKQRRMLGGLGAGASFALAAGFALQGFGWPMRYVSILRRNLIPEAHRPTLFQWFRGDVEYIMAAVVLVVLYLWSRRRAAPIALATTIVAGVLIGRHATNAYLLFIIPAGLLAFESAGRTQRLLLVGALTPPGFLLASATPSALPVLPLTVLAVVLLFRAEVQMKCFSCGFLLPTVARSCPQCGLPLQKKNPAGNA
jgi:hypothetical protein